MKSAAIACGSMVLYLFTRLTQSTPEQQFACGSKVLTLSICCSFFALWAKNEQQNGCNVPLRTRSHVAPR